MILVCRELDPCILRPGPTAGRPSAASAPSRNRAPPTPPTSTVTFTPPSLRRRERHGQLAEAAYTSQGRWSCCEVATRSAKSLRKRAHGAVVADRSPQRDGVRRPGPRCATSAAGSRPDPGDAAQQLRPASPPARVLHPCATAAQARITQRRAESTPAVPLPVGTAGSRPASRSQPRGPTGRRDHRSAGASSRRRAARLGPSDLLERAEGTGARPTRAPWRRTEYPGIRGCASAAGVVHDANEVGSSASPRQAGRRATTQRPGRRRVRVPSAAAASRVVAGPSGVVRPADRRCVRARWVAPAPAQRGEDPGRVNDVGGRHSAVAVAPACTPFFLPQTSAEKQRRDVRRRLAASRAPQNRARSARRHAERGPRPRSPRRRTAYVASIRTRHVPADGRAAATGRRNPHTSRTSDSPVGPGTQPTVEPAGRDRPTRARSHRGAHVEPVPDVDVAREPRPDASSPGNVSTLDRDRPTGRGSSRSPSGGTRSTRR